MKLVAKYVPYNEVLLNWYIYFWGLKYRSLYKGLRDIEVRLMEVSLHMDIQLLSSFHQRLHQIPSLFTKFNFKRLRFVIYFVIFLRLLVKGALEVNETRLHKELFKGYNKHAHPRLPGTGPVTVTFDFQLIRILDVVRFYNLKLAI